MISLNLTHTAEYALRAMSFLALLPEEESVPATFLAEKTHVPLHYLLKVMRKLVATGLVLSSKGHGGGFRLARPANRISYRHILEAMGYQKSSASCVFGWGKCRDSHPCPMHETWSKLNKMFGTWAEDTTLEHIVDFTSDQKIFKDMQKPR